jgi:CO/xanthine dehydrogenase Mo-binding subunit
VKVDEPILYDAARAMLVEAAAAKWSVDPSSRAK